MEMKTEVKFVDNDAVPRSRSKYDHWAIAEQLVSRPGSWAEVGLPVSYASGIRRGDVLAYPESMFEVKVSKGKLFMRFIGTVEEYESHGDTARVYDHEALRAELRELGPGSGVWRADWPKSYVSLIKRGRLGYTPAGAWSATYVKDFGLGVTFVGGGDGHE